MEDPSASTESDTKQYAVIPQSTYCLENASVVDVRQEVLKVYEDYCVSYPNPSLAIENEERDRLLRAISAADHAVEVNPKKKQKRGFFGSLFGAPKDDDDDRARRRIQVQDDDDRLDYSPTEPLPADTWLLGTEFSLDTTNIPDDAHSVARQHLLARQPNILRGSTAVLVAPGVLAWDGATVVLPIGPSDPTATDCIAHARAALIHPHLLAVSWRPADVDVVLYELVVTGNDDDEGAWQPVAGLGPAPEVQAHVRNTEWDFADEENGGATSTLLAVTDVLAWNEATLVVARLGGFIEVIPLGLGREDPPIAVTTAEYHVDVLGVEAVSDCVLAAHGRTLDHHQVITFWSMEEDGMTLLQEIDVDRLGPDVSIFCSPIILQHWRKPRAVSLRGSSDTKEAKEAPVTTISVSAPIVSLQCRDGRFLAILDWNGGVSILDCNFAEAQFQIFLSRTTTSPVGVRSLQWIDEDIVTLNRRGELLWNDATIASVPTSSSAALTDQHMVVQTKSKLHVCSIQELTATAVVQSFVMNEQFAEALAAAQRLGEKERRTIDTDIEHCKRELWEREGDVQLLSSMHDDAYVIQQALDVSSGNIDFAAVCRLALERLQTTRLGASLSLARNLEELEGVGTKIRDRLLKYGTFELLCDRLSVECNLSDFFSKFVNTSMDELAHQFAENEDMVSSSLIWFRHIFDVDAWELLESIPLSIAPTCYQHLLPTCTPGTFLESAKSTTEIINFPGYFCCRFDSDVATDDEDEALVVARAQEWATKSDAKEQGEIVAWYMTRASNIAEHAPTLHNISVFGELALKALDLNYAKDAAELLQFSTYLKAVLSLVSGHTLDNSIFTSLVSLSLCNVDVLSKSNLVALVMDSPLEGAADRLHNVLVPMMRNLDPTKSSSDLFQELDQAVTSYIRNALQAFVGRDKVDSDSFIAEAQRCSALVWASRSSLDKKKRLISEQTMLCSLVMQLTGSLLEISADADLRLSQQTLLMDVLWMLFESLPAEDENAPGEVNVLSNRLYKVFTAVDICSRWPFALKHFPRRQALEEHHKSAPASLRYAERTVVSILRSVCIQLKQSSYEVALEVVMCSMLHDIELINSVCFEGAVDLVPLVNESFVQRVLEMERIDALAALLTSEASSALNKSTISKLVLEIFKEAVYETNNLQLADDLQMLLTPYFPELNHEFAASKSFLDAAAHIRDLIQDDSISFSPRDLREVPPIDVIETVLDHSPFCFVQHCMQWRDWEWSQQANAQIRQHLHSGNSSRRPDLPPLPGLPLYHLAQLLSLEGSTSVIAVKSRVVHHAVRCGAIGAAAAVCRTLLVDTFSTNADPDPSFSAVAEVVTDTSFSDQNTKRELCETALFHCTKVLSREGAKTLNAIAAVWVSTEKGPELHNDGNASVVGSLFAETPRKDDSDLDGLFLSLASQIQRSSVEEKLLHTLARSVLCWCIRHRTGTADCSEGYFRTSVDGATRLSLSLLLHLLDGEQILKSVSDVNNILTEQIALVSGASMESGQTSPRPDIVDALVHRGYSEHGALRAAISTGNAGFDQALQWAIANSMDPGFDAPLVFVRNGPVKATNDFDLHRAEVALAELISSLRRHGSTSVINTSSPPKTDELRDSVMEEEKYEDGWSDFDDDIETSEVKNVRPQFNIDATLPEPPAGQQLGKPSSLNGFSARTAARPRDTPGSTRSFPSFSDPSPRSANLPRSMLLQVGQAAFRSAKKVKSPANEERQRLIEQGRAFFRQVHHASTESFGKQADEAQVASGSNCGGDEWDFEDDVSF